MFPHPPGLKCMLWPQQGAHCGPVALHLCFGCGRSFLVCVLCGTAHLVGPVVFIAPLQPVRQRRQQGLCTSGCSSSPSLPFFTVHPRPCACRFSGRVHGPGMMTLCSDALTFTESSLMVCDTWNGETACGNPPLKLTCSSQLCSSPVEHEDLWLPALLVSLSVL